MMKKIILGLACAAALLGTTVQAKEIRLASDFTYPPFNYKNSDELLPVGFDIEIADALCEQAKLNYIRVSQSWDSLIPNFIGKKIRRDYGFNAYYRRRKRKILFTDKYYQTPTAVVCRCQKYRV